jgi:hypothetical protein
MALNWQAFTNNYNNEIKKMNNNNKIFGKVKKLETPRLPNVPIRPPTKLPPLPPVIRKPQSPVVNSPKPKVFVPYSINNKIKALYNQLIVKNIFTKENINKLSNKNKLNLQQYIINKHNKINKNYNLERALAGNFPPSYLKRKKPVIRQNKIKVNKTVVRSPSGFRNFIKQQKKVTQRKSPNFVMKTKIRFENFSVGSRIGTESAFGQVFKLKDMSGNMEEYVLKRIRFANKTAEKSFETEIRVGSIPGIEEVGPRVYAHRVVTKENGSKYGEYIMDNITQGEKYEKVEDLEHYLIRNYGSHSCPYTGSREPIVKALHGTLLRFYQLTGGSHGDLHDGNIFVLTDSNGKIKVRFIDFGAFKDFKNKRISQCVSDYLNRELAGQYTNRAKNDKRYDPGYVKNFNNESQPHTNNRTRLSHVGLHNRVEHFIPNNYNSNNNNNNNKRSNKQKKLNNFFSPAVIKTMKDYFDHLKETMRPSPLFHIGLVLKQRQINKGINLTRTNIENYNRLNNNKNNNGVIKKYFNYRPATKYRGTPYTIKLRTQPLKVHIIRALENFNQNAKDWYINSKTKKYLPLAFNRALELHRVKN